MAASKALTTDRQVAALKAGALAYEARIDGGLIVRVYPSGAKVFEFRYRNAAGKRRRLSIGHYPDTSLATARQKAIAHRLSVSDSLDPAEILTVEKQTAKAEAAPVVTGPVREEDQTLSWLAEKYWVAAALGLHGGRGKPKSDTSLVVEKSRWKNHLAPDLGDRPYAELTRKQIKTFMRGFVIAGKLSADTISGIGGVLSNILTYAVEEEWLEVNPARGVTKPLAGKSRTRMLDNPDLKTVWNALVQASVPRVPGVQRADMHARLEPPTALALRFAMLTLCRRQRSPAQGGVRSMTSYAPGPFLRRV